MASIDNHTQRPAAQPAAAPTLIIGLGGTGAKCVDAIKARMKQLQEGEASRVQFLALDTDFTDLREMEHLEDHERFFVEMPNLMTHPEVRTREAWNEILNERVGAILASQLNRYVQDVYVISGACGNTGAGVFLKLPGMLERMGCNARFCGIVFLSDVYRPVIPAQRESLETAERNLMKAWTRGEDRTDGCEGYRRRWKVDGNAENVYEAVWMVAEGLFRELTEPDLKNNLEAVGLWNVGQNRPFCRMGISCLGWDQEGIRNEYLQALLKHVGVSEPGADGFRFLGEKPRLLKDLGERMACDLVKPIEELHHLMVRMDNAYLHEFIIMGNSEGLRYLIGEGEQEMMKRQQKVIQRELSPQAIQVLEDEVRRIFNFLYKKLWQIIQQEGLDFYFNLYHGRFLDQNGESVQGVGLRQALNYLGNGLRLDGKPALGPDVEYADRRLKDAYHEIVGTSPINRIFHAQRLRGMWVDAFHKLGVARVYDQRKQLMMGRGGILERELLTPMEKMTGELERFAWMLENICRDSQRFGRTSGMNYMGQMSLNGMGSYIRILGKIRQDVARVDPKKFREFLLESGLNDFARWEASPREAFEELLAHTVRMEELSLELFFREREWDGYQLASTANQLIRELSDRCYFHANPVQHDMTQVVYMLIPEYLSREAPEILNALICAAENLEINVHPILSRGRDLCMIRCVSGIAPEQLG